MNWNKNFYIYIHWDNLFHAFVYFYSVIIYTAAHNFSANTQIFKWIICHTEQTQQMLYLVLTDIFFFTNIHKFRI